MTRLAGKVALVTGSTQGLGEGIALRFAREGAKLIVNGRSAQKGASVVEKLRAVGADAVFIRADTQVVPDLIEASDDRNDDHLDLALHSGLYASLWAGQAALPFFRAAGGGRIVNFASVNGVYGSKYGNAYNATKEAIRGLTRTLANEWGRYNVTVNVVLPSGMSPSYAAFFRDDPKKADTVARLNPMRRHGRAQEDIGSAVLGLVSDHGRFITGQSLFIDGGANLLGLPQLHSMGTIFQ